MNRIYLKLDYVLKILLVNGHGNLEIYCKVVWFLGKMYYLILVIIKYFTWKFLMRKKWLYNKYKSYNKVALEMSKTKKISRQIISIWYKRYQDILDFLAERIKKTTKHE